MVFEVDTWYFILDGSGKQGVCARGSLSFMVHWKMVQGRDSNEPSAPSERDKREPRVAEKVWAGDGRDFVVNSSDGKCR